MAVQKWYILPQSVTVHMGKPDETAENKTVSFPEYMKNTASSEIDPTLPEKTIRRRVSLLLQFALGRIGGRFYRNRGYPFDVTALPQYDRKFSGHGRTYENVNRIVNEILDGITGTPLHGSERMEGEKKAAPVSGQVYPGYPLKAGSSGAAVQAVQLELNRIAENYPSIAPIALPNGVFGTDTEEAVRQFQRISGIVPDGVVGRDTWYKLRHVYEGVRRFSGLLYDGKILQASDHSFTGSLKDGAFGQSVGETQYHINVVSYFYPQVPSVALDEFYGPKTAAAVKAFQKLSYLVEDGIVGQNTWHSMGVSCGNIMGCVNGCFPAGYAENRAAAYPGYVLSKGMENSDVGRLQKYLDGISLYYGTIPQMAQTGVYDEATAAAVAALQQQNGITATGAVDGETWDLIARLYDTR